MILERYPEAVSNLIEELKTLPGIGRRGAERMALALLKKHPNELRNLGGLLTALPDKVGKCPECGAWADAGNLCSICSSPLRDSSLLCVVESMPHLLTIEKSGHYHGRYLVLGGKLSPLDYEDGSNLNLAGLQSQLEKGQISEVILALSPDVEGRATAAYLREILKSYPVKVTQPAQGLPAGANLSFTDAATITAALRGRLAQDD